MNDQTTRPGTIRTVGLHALDLARLGRDGDTGLDARGHDLGELELEGGADFDGHACGEGTAGGELAGCLGEKMGC